MNEDDMQAYTYTIKHNPSGKYYYGVRKSKSFDLGTVYFSSSKLVKRLIIEEGISNFEFKIRRKFNSYEQARRHEYKILSRLKVPNNNRLLNQAISSPRVCNKDHTSEQNRRESISKSMKELWKDPSYRASSKFTQISKEDRSSRGRAGALKKAEKYKTGELQRKPKSPVVYKQVIIVKGDNTKLVASNQVPAYSKYGWSRQ